jgi:hypothetical protein
VFCFHKNTQNYSNKNIQFDVVKHIDSLVITAKLRKFVVDKNTQKMDKVLCFLFGHKDNDETDSGYHWCRRCMKHEWFDNDTYFMSAYLFKPVWYIKRKCNLLLSNIRIRFYNQLPF